GGPGSGPGGTLNFGASLLSYTVDIETSTINLFKNINTLVGGSTSNGSIKLGGNVFLQSSIQLNYDRTYSALPTGLPGGLDITGAVNLGGNTLTAVDGALTDVGVISGAITGAGSLVKEGPGTLMLKGLGSTYSGTTSIQSGTLEIGAPFATSAN